MHYHGGPLSGPRDTMGRFWRGRHAMVSFAYPENLPLLMETCQSVAIDNGAFSAWKSGKALDVQAYGEWVEEWSRHPCFDWCLIPDVIDGTEDDNADMIYRWTTTLPGALIRSVPVWHLHERLTHLQQLAAQFQTVALGSSGQWATPGASDWWERIGEAMSAVCDERGRPRCRLHGLRMLNPAIFTRLPFASADSTNAAQNAGSVSRFGYAPPEAWQRADVIAERIEAFNSAARWVKKEEEVFELFELASV